MSWMSIATIVNLDFLWKSDEKMKVMVKEQQITKVFRSSNARENLMASA